VESITKKCFPVVFTAQKYFSNFFLFFIIFSNSAIEKRRKGSKNNFCSSKKKFKKKSVPIFDCQFLGDKQFLPIFTPYSKRPIYCIPMPDVKNQEGSWGRLS
jgi:hypothetical protein